MNLIVANVIVRNDSEGRYHLNDLHKASGGEDKNKPSHWFNNKQTQELVELLNSRNSASLSVVTKDGRGGGTYVCKQLVYSYAMWLSAEFNLKVIEAYDGIIQQERAEHDRVTSRQQARLEAPLMTKALQDARARQGKDSPPHVFSNDYDMIYRIVLGFPAKKYKVEQGIDDKTNLRDVLTLEQIKAVEALQRLNQSMHDLDYDFDKRKEKLHQVFMRNHAPDMIAEIERLNA